MRLDSRADDFLPSDNGRVWFLTMKAVSRLIILHESVRTISDYVVSRSPETGVTDRTKESLTGAWLLILVRRLSFLLCQIHGLTVRAQGATGT